MIGEPAGSNVDVCADMGDGNDIVDASAVRSQLYGGSGDDTLIGSPHDDTIDGGTGADIVKGGGDRDLLVDEDGTDDGDVLDGGPGKDQLDAGRSRKAFDIDLSRPAMAPADRYTNIENAFGSSHADTLRAADTGSVLSGGDGNDKLLGGRGADELRGDGGADDIRCGGGRDRVVQYPVINDADVDTVAGDCESLSLVGSILKGNLISEEEALRADLAHFSRSHGRLRLKVTCDARCIITAVVRTTQRKETDNRNADQALPAEI